jgi:hypothetical protein
MSERQSIPLTEIIDDLREKLGEEFKQDGEYSSRAYYPPEERDSDDHEAVVALQVLEPLIGSEFRDELRDAYKKDRWDLNLGYLREGEKTTEDRYALVALGLAHSALIELVEAGMGLRE